MKYLPIAIIADQDFFLPSVVAITSLLENKKQESVYKIYFINVGFTEEQKLKVLSIEKKYSTQIVLCDINEEELKARYICLAKHDCCASITALIKFDLPYICREEETLLYLDGDIIVQNDLSELGNCMFEDEIYVKAVIDTGVLYSSKLIRQPVDDYFNSGVMLLNLAAMRRDKISELLVKEKFISTDNSLMDQHVFNSVFISHKELLPHKYNVLYVNLVRAHYFHGITVEQINEMMHTNYISWRDMREKATIIHYSSFDKPWKYSDVDGVEIWNDYFEKSVVSNTILNRKRLHIKIINCMRAHRLTSLVGSFIWECEIMGIRLALKDTKKFLKMRRRQ